MTNNHMTLFCLVDGEATSNAFPVEIDSTKTIGGLKDLIKAKKTNDFRDVDADKLTLWRVSIPITDDEKKNSIQLNSVTSDKTRLGPADDISEVFEVQPPKKTIHIIVQRPPQGVMDVRDIIQNIKKTWNWDILTEEYRRSSGSFRTLPEMMPYQERDTEKAINRVVKNVTTCLSREPTLQPAKSASAFLVCSGTAGIGKTRFGRELSNALVDQLSLRYQDSQPVEMKDLDAAKEQDLDAAKEQDLDAAKEQDLEAVKEKEFIYSPKHLYLLLDFNNGLRLGAQDENLEAEVILGLRLAYLHFFEGKSRKKFPDFRLKAHDFCQSFTISAVVDAIRENLKLPVGKPLFLFLHIDEYQSVLSFTWQGTPKSRHPLPVIDTEKVGEQDHTKEGLGDPQSRTGAGESKKQEYTEEGLSLFQEMLRCLGGFLSGEIKPNIIQTFLSGTARQEVTQSVEPTFYSLSFFECPTLSLGACYDIMGHFVDMANEKVFRSDWMPEMAYFHLLSATGGLPRALQLLLEDIFGTKLERCAKFKDHLKTINMNAEGIFIRVAHELDERYKIRSFVKTHKEIIDRLLRLYILQTPKSRNYAPVQSGPFKELTLEDLESRTHTILEDSDDASGDVLVRIPYFFLYIYNQATDVVRNCLGSTFAQNWKRRGWRFFEDIVAEYETLRTNLLISDGMETSTLRDIYRALGREETLGRTVKLRELSPPVKADHWFPRKKLTVRGQEQDWRSNVVIKNCDGAPFADICVYRESAEHDGDNILCALQAKNRTVRVTQKTLKDEHGKNGFKALRNLLTLAEQRAKRERAITVLITTGDIDQALLQQLKSESCPDDCLVIYQGNFANFFGEAFGILAVLADSKDQNWNFTTREMLKKKHTLDDREVEQVLHNMPYRSYDDLVQKVPSLASKGVDKQVGFLPYQGVRPEKKRRVE